MTPNGLSIAGHHQSLLHFYLVLKDFPISKTANPPNTNMIAINSMTRN